MIVLSPDRAQMPYSLTRFLRFGLLCVAGLTLASCGNMVESGSVYYNAGLANSVNSILLKNIVRSAKDYPLYYSALGDFSYNLTREVSLDPSIEFDSDIDVSLGLSTDKTNDRSTTVSSLETADFTQAIHSDLSANTLVFFTAGHSHTHWNLLLMLTTDLLTVTRLEYEHTLHIAYESCLERESKVSKTVRALCLNVLHPTTISTCASHPIDTSNPVYITLRNEPSNPCEFVLFRNFVEAIVATDPNIAVQDDGTPKITLKSVNDSLVLFETDGTGIFLRSPHEIIHYLGKILRLTFQGEDEGLLTITSPSGERVPIILVEDGRRYTRVAVETQVDGTTYWIPEQSIRSPRSHYSFIVLGVLKNLISLNTSQSQLPSNPTRVIVK